MKLKFNLQQTKKVVFLFIKNTFQHTSILKHLLIALNQINNNYSHPIRSFLKFYFKLINRYILSVNKTFLESYIDLRLQKQAVLFVFYCSKNIKTF